jgi:hypothetical protein
MPEATDSAHPVLTGRDMMTGAMAENARSAI